jgi:DNA-binding NtrC family response regulator
MALLSGMLNGFGRHDPLSQLKSSQHTILLVEDRDTMRRSLRRLLTEEHYRVSEASNVATARTLLFEEQPDLVLTDLKLPDGEGTELLSETVQLPRPPPTIILTAYGSVEAAVEAMKRGAYEFLTKPVDSERLRLLVGRALEESARRWRYELLARERDTVPKTIVGRSNAFLEVLRRAESAASTDTTVLILGESGTGKELLARMIHDRSPRARGSFVPVNCAAIAASLAESALFGHEKGAFTGAGERHRGWFELAHEGTLFLDEIGDLEPGLQGKLLRVLEDHQFQRVGGSRWISADVRVIVASNKDLEQEIEAGRFRKDLYYRVAVFPLTLPPLRQRPEDIQPLAEHYVDYYATLLGKKVPAISPLLLDNLNGYHWPGNVRELMNVIERAIILTTGEVVEAEHFRVGGIKGDRGHVHFSLPMNLRQFINNSVREIETQAISAALRQTQGKRGEAAGLLRITYRTLLNKLKAYGMDSE